jgi:hypothetical protein
MVVMKYGSFSLWERVGVRALAQTITTAELRALARHPLWDFRSLNLVKESAVGSSR